MLGPDGKILNAAIQIGDSVIMLVDEFKEWGSFGPKSLNGSPVTIHLYVENADQAFDRAVSAGARVKLPLDDMFWGDSYGQLEIRPSLSVATSGPQPGEIQMRPKNLWLTTRRRESPLPL